MTEQTAPVRVTGQDEDVRNTTRDHRVDFGGLWSYLNALLLTSVLALDHSSHSMNLKIGVALLYALCINQFQRAYYAYEQLIHGAPVGCATDPGTNIDSHLRARVCSGCGNRLHTYHSGDSTIGIMDHGIRLALRFQVLDKAPTFCCLEASRCKQPCGPSTKDVIWCPATARDDAQMERGLRDSTATSEEPGRLEAVDNVGGDRFIRQPWAVWGT